ncbi:alpha-ketoacid dehydrogenase subunit beta, partial [bacterium]|nr:alpha-ketoacid dehydrogenase subunit beta [bacterium]
AEVITCIAEKAFGALKGSPQRVTLPDCPTPTTPALANKYYPRVNHIVATARKMLGLRVDNSLEHMEETVPLDVPDRSFTGPF